MSAPDPIGIGMQGNQRSPQIWWKLVDVVETLLMLDLLIAAKVPILPGPAEEMWCQ